MAVARNKTEVSSDKLLEEARQLSLPELEKFVAQVIALQAHRKAPRLPESEANLLKIITCPVPEEIRTRYRELVASRQSLAITEEEYSELLALTDQIELGDARRVEAIGALAALRNTTIDALMDSLGIRPSYA